MSNATTASRARNALSQMTLWDSPSSVLVHNRRRPQSTLQSAMTTHSLQASPCSYTYATCNVTRLSESMRCGVSSPYRAFTLRIIIREDLEPCTVHRPHVSSVNDSQFVALHGFIYFSRNPPQNASHGPLARNNISTQTDCPRKCPSVNITSVTFTLVLRM